MKLILIDGKKKFEVRPGKFCHLKKCSFARIDDNDDFCNKKCYIPSRYMKFIDELSHTGFALKEIKTK